MSLVVTDSMRPAPSHLLVVQLGPVQEFIAQARRTRDLWFGSHLLCELSRAAAKAAAAHGALIFPALRADDPELEPCNSLLRDGVAPLSIANKIVVELAATRDPASAAQAIRHAVTVRWRAIADEVRTTYETDLADGIDDVWNEQIGSLVEFAAAWAPIDRDYSDVRHHVEAALGGRRRLRDFAVYRHHREGAPASSLDGGRVSVLAPPGTRRARRAERRLLLGDGESLDAVGVVKRRGGDPEQFLSVVHVAVGPWLRQASTVAVAELEALRTACADLRVHDPETGAVRYLDRTSRTELPGAKLFPHNASVLFASRLPDVFEELGATKEEAATQARVWDDTYLRPLAIAAGAPPSYVACLVADGDRMGPTIDGLHSAEAHRELARGLGGFPRVARRIVEQEYDGIVVYAGGDDVLAFLPVGRAVACADALRLAFAEEIQPALERARSIDRGAAHSPAVGSGSTAPTLSVGVGIGHVLDSLGHLRSLGRRAETAAKERRNSLALLVDRRSGGDYLWSASWADDPHRRLSEDVGLIAHRADRSARLPMGKVHELARLLRDLSVPVAGAIADLARRAAPLEPDVGALVLCGETERILARAHRGATASLPDDEGADGAAEPATSPPVGLTPAEVGLTLDAQAGFRDVYVQLSRWVARQQIAHVLAASDPNTAEVE